MNHFAIIDYPGRDGTYSWFCNETTYDNCDGEGFGFATDGAAVADAIASGHKIGQNPGRFDGIPGLVWYAKVTPTRGDELKVGDWLDSLDHRGARSIYEFRAIGGGSRDAVFSFGDAETVRDDVMYDVVDPDSQVQPDGSPL